MKKLLKQFRDDDTGAAMVEYSILVGIITVATIVAIVFVGGWVGTQWGDLQAALVAA